MLGARSISVLTKPVVKGQCRQMSVISGPPSVHVPTAEKIAVGALLSVSFLAYPAWVLVNLKNYKKKD